MEPGSLRGVPVQRIDEHSKYWETSWSSLDEFLGHESEEKALKESYQILKNQGPHDPAIYKRAKLHQDNMSKHVKIREIFSDVSSYHPNQLVSKHHLPVYGLCQKEMMYRIACKISDLKVLNSKGILKMDAWDFLRWRVHLRINEKINHIGESAKGFVRSTIFNLFDHQDGSATNSVMREAILLSAQYQNRLASFRTHANDRKTPGTTVQKYLKGPTTKPPPGQLVHQPSLSKAVIRQRVKMDARSERRRLLKAQPGTYQGVNAFRAQRREK